MCVCGSVSVPAGSKGNEKTMTQTDDTNGDRVVSLSLKRNPLEFRERGRDGSSSSSHSLYLPFLFDQRFYKKSQGRVKRESQERERVSTRERVKRESQERESRERES